MSFFRISFNVFCFILVLEQQIIRSNTRNSTPASSVAQGDVEQSQDVIAKCACGVNEVFIKIILVCLTTLILLNYLVLSKMNDSGKCK